MFAKDKKDDRAANDVKKLSDGKVATEEKRTEQEVTGRNEAQGGTQLAVPEVAGAPPAELAGLMGDDLGKGTSTAAADNMVPLVYILQTNSPGVNKRDAAYIDGAEPGDLWLRNAPVPVVPGEDGFVAQVCYFYKDVGEWVPRDSGGGGGTGFVTRHPWNEDHPDGVPADAVKVLIEGKGDDSDKEVWMTPDKKHELVPTRNFVLLVYTPFGALPYVFPLSGSGHSAARQWMFLQTSKKIQGQPVPSWACLYRVVTKQRKKGTNSWFMIEASDERREGAAPGPCWVTKEQYAAGKTLHEAFASGLKQAEAPVQADSGASSGAADTSREDGAKI